MAARRNKRMVTQTEFEDAKDKVMMGAERKSLVMTEEEKLLTAYHEGGHALVALNVPATDPVHKATIIPRGRALGMVMQLPERDKLSMSLEQMTSRLAIMMGGRVAEELIFGKDKVTSGAASDIEQATKLARMMVTRWGFSERARHRRLRREPGRGVPRPLGGAPAEHLGVDRAEDRFGNPPAGRGGLPGGQRHPHRQARRARAARQGPARIRDAVRRRDQGPPQRQAPAPRVGDRAVRRRAPPRSPTPASRARGPTPAAWSRSRRPKSPQAFARVRDAGRIIRPAFSFVQPASPRGGAT